MHCNLNTHTWQWTPNFKS